MATREKIIETAKSVFNKQGFGAVSLHEIAREVGISRGNLTYHFANKDALLRSISETMWQKLNSERNKSRQFPSFKNLHDEVQLVYNLQKEYSFIFLDTHVLNHPIIRKRNRDMMKQMILDNKAAIAFSIKLGNMKAETVTGLYNNIAVITWMLTFYWLPQEVIRGKKSPVESEKMIWSILIPHFTSKGRRSFKKFFGDEYFKSLGEPFDPELNNISVF